jgi:hypothetical protein
MRIARSSLEYQITALFLLLVLYVFVAIPLQSVGVLHRGSDDLE